MNGRFFGIVAALCLAVLSGPALAGEDLKGGAGRIAEGFRDVGKSAGHNGKKAGKATRDAARETGRATGKALTDVGKGLKKAFR